LYLGGRRGWAALALALALLSKETAVLTPVLAVLLDRRAGEPWRLTARRAWPLGSRRWHGSPLWLAMSSGAHRARATAPGRWRGGGARAPLQVVTGLEWGPGGIAGPGSPPGSGWRSRSAAGAVLWLWSARTQAEPRPRLRRALAGDPRWVGVGGPRRDAGEHCHPLLERLRIPVRAVRRGARPGAWAARRSRGVALVVLALLALARPAPWSRTVAIDYLPWTTVSHINRFRAPARHALQPHVSRCCVPRIPSCRPQQLFFAGLTKGSSFQTGERTGGAVGLPRHERALVLPLGILAREGEAWPDVLFTLERDTLVERR